MTDLFGLYSGSSIIVHSNYYVLLLYHKLCTVLISNPYNGTVRISLMNSKYTNHPWNPYFGIIQPHGIIAQIQAEPFQPADPMMSVPLSRL